MVIRVDYPKGKGVKRYNQILIHIQGIHQEIDEDDVVISTQYFNTETNEVGPLVTAEKK